jgi:large subunit ribosomal protein L23
MDLTIYDIIRGPRITEKAYYLNQVHKQLVLDVHPKATKPQVKEALKKLFNVEVEKVRIIVSKGKTRRVGRRVVVGILKKRAIITLKEGHSMDLLAMSAPAQHSGQSHSTGVEE